MKGLSAKISRGMNLGALVVVADNSGGKIARIVSVKGGKSRKGRQIAAGIADLVKVSIRKGLPEMKGQVFDAVVIRQKREWRRFSGERICFSDNAVALLKDDKNPRGTMVRGPVAKEIAERWPAIAKIAPITV